MQRIGVFVCWCGSNIAATVDVNAVSEALAREPGVVFSTNYQYMCSESGQNLIKDAIKEHQLTGVVICSCSPRMHEATFRKTVAAAGLNSYMLEIANIREQCSWIHKDKAEATEKAIILGRAAIAKVQLNAPLTPGTSPVTKRALVIGGGIAGIQTALDIADAGFEVDIVEKQPTIGGKMTQIDKTFPTLDCAACILTPKMVDCAQNEKINIFAYSEVEEVKGFVGSFTVKIKKKARYVDPVKCTGCGECTEKCPMKKIPNEFNLGLDTRRAIYIPFAQAVPKVATIDPDHCNMLKNGKCGLCAKVCSAGAIDYKQKDEIVEREYGAIVVATGYNPIKLDDYDEYAYSQSKDVVSSLEFERLTNAAGPTGGTLLRPSDGKHPHTIVFVQCVGSRCSAEGKGKSYCSKICCMYTAKHAMLTREKYPDTDVYVFYIDVRSPGKNYDEFYRRAVEEYGVHYIKGMVGKVVPRSDGKLLVQASDLLANEQLHIEADMVVLAAAIEPDKSARPRRARSGDDADRLHGHQRLLHRSPRQAAPRGEPDGGHLPLRRVPGPQGHPGHRRPGGRRGLQGHRAAGQGQADRQPLHRAPGRVDVQRLLLLREGLPLRRHLLRGQGVPHARPHHGHPPRRGGQRGGLPGLRRLHGRLPLRRDGPQGLLEQPDYGGG